MRKVAVEGSLPNLYSSLFLFFCIILQLSLLKKGLHLLEVKPSWSGPDLAQSVLESLLPSCMSIPGGEWNAKPQCRLFTPLLSFVTFCHIILGLSKKCFPFLPAKVSARLYHSPYLCMSPCCPALLWSCKGPPNNMTSFKRDP